MYFNCHIPVDEATLWPTRSSTVRDSLFSHLASFARPLRKVPEAGPGHPIAEADPLRHEHPEAARMIQSVPAQAIDSASYHCKLVSASASSSPLLLARHVGRRSVANLV